MSYIAHCMIKDCFYPTVPFHPERGQFKEHLKDRDTGGYLHVNVYL